LPWFLNHEGTKRTKRTKRQISGFYDFRSTAAEPLECCRPVAVHGDDAGVAERD
jgi:hypothetical protein